MRAGPSSSSHASMAGVGRPQPRLRTASAAATLALAGARPSCMICTRTPMAVAVCRRANSTTWATCLGLPPALPLLPRKNWPAQSRRASGYVGGAIGSPSASSLPTSFLLQPCSEADSMQASLAPAARATPGPRGARSCRQGAMRAAGHGGSVAGGRPPNRLLPRRRASPRSGRSAARQAPVDELAGGCRRLRLRRGGSRWRSRRPGSRLARGCVPARLPISGSVSAARSHLSRHPVHRRPRDRRGDRSTTRAGLTPGSGRTRPFRADGPPVP